THGATAVVVRVAAIDQLDAVAGDCSPFSAGKMFGVLEAEATDVTDGATFTSLVLGEPGLAGVLYHDQVVFFCHRVDRVHVAGHAENMDRDDRLGSFGDSAFD